MTLPLKLFDHLDMPLWIASRATCDVLWANSAARALLGCDSDDPGAGAGLAGEVRGDLAERIRTAAAATEPDAPFAVEWPVPAGGRLREMRVWCCETDHAGGPAVLVAPAGDNAGDMPALPWIERTEAMVSLFERSGAPLYTSRAARERHGGADLPLEARFDDPAELHSLLERLAAAGRASATLRLAARGEAGERWHRVEARLSRGAGTGSDTLELVELDVSDSIEAARVLEAERDAAIHADRAKSDFLARMSHEIRTQLTGVIGVSILLWNRLQEGPDKELAGRLVDAGKTLEHITNEIVELSRIEAGELRLDETEFRPFDLVDAMAAGHELTAREREIEFEVLASEGANLPRIGDTHRLLQIAANLISNAIRFTEKGSVQVRLRGAEGEPLVIEVEDTGIGMSEEEQSRMFDRYAQARSATAGEFGGTGLGLHIVKELVTAMRGTIEVRSAQGKGTTVRVELPLPMAARTSDRPAARDAFHGLRVLVLADNSTDLAVVERLLDTLGTRPASVASGREAREALARTAFDLIMIDTEVPEADADDLLDAIAEADAGRGGWTPVVAITPQPLPLGPRTGADAGFDASVAKPLRVEEFSACLEGLLAHGAARGSAARRRRAPGVARGA
jgi:signal transduction histidine kinase/CheY-like chemotaxis protein